ncbi:Acyltransferase family protein [Litoreibacter ascidiaceicola]|uniref:Acyltransferase family protein n=1 Tax=Litoreibacter ascidiaceicola TaxID=1486859 RepID=A0A1M4TMB1_9RHOB|nr:acyltransferase [Litoreibacter ascidiaceicola]SHE45600.1 Acyltransferase family protein [Litoreibacter ascidiaceicola]
MSTSPAKEKMPKGLLAAATWAAERTPDSRNRAVDLYRAIAIMFVILGHWLLVAGVIRDGELNFVILLAEQRWTHYATWLFQVMPVFFFVGGFSNGLSWTSARKDPVKKSAWAASRLSRLLKPTVPVVLVWAIAGAVAHAMGVSVDLISSASQAALVPVWFLAVYIIMTMAVPVTVAMWDRLGVASVGLLALAAIAVDVIAFGADQGWLRWSNYAFVWLAVHQLGYWWGSAERPKSWALGFIALGVAWLYVLIVQFGFPVAMVSVPGAEMSNTRPPTTAMLAVGAVQIGVILLLTDLAQAWLRNVRVWAWVIVFNQMIMSIYLWHMTALLIVVGIAAYVFGGAGLHEPPGTGLWWAVRPIWVVLFTLVLIPFVLVFVRFEAGSKTTADMRPGPWQAMLGAVMTCSGLVVMAMVGLGKENAIGVNWLAVGLVVLGVFVATRRFSRS